VFKSWFKSQSRLGIAHHCIYQNVIRNANAKNRPTSSSSSSSSSSTLVVFGLCYRISKTLKYKTNSLSTPHLTSLYDGSHYNRKVFFRYFSLIKRNRVVIRVKNPTNWHTECIYGLINIMYNWQRNGAAPAQL